MHVVGLSMGGMIAFQLVVDHPELVRSLVIVNSGPELVLRTWQQKLAIYQRFAIVRLFGMRKMGEMLSSRLLPEPKWAARRRLFIERWARNDKSAYLRATRALIGWSVSKHLPSIQQPTLVVTADRDYTPVAFKEAYAAQMPNARLAVIANARHMLPIELPGDFNQTVLSFLAGLGAERVPSLPAIKSAERV